MRIERGKNHELSSEAALHWISLSMGVCVCVCMCVCVCGESLNMVTAKPGHKTVSTSQTQTEKQPDLVHQLGMFSMATPQTRHKGLRSQRLGMKGCNVQAEALGLNAGAPQVN